MGTVEEKSHKTIDELFSEMEQAIADPQKTFEKYRSDNQKAIGCLPYFAPYELVDAAGMLLRRSLQQFAPYLLRDTWHAPSRKRYLR